MSFIKKIVKKSKEELEKKKLEQIFVTKEVKTNG
jgi:hypothetical protein